MTNICGCLSESECPHYASTYVSATSTAEDFLLYPLHLHQWGAGTQTSSLQKVEACATLFDSFLPSIEFTLQNHELLTYFILILPHYVDRVSKNCCKL